MPDTDTVCPVSVAVVELVETVPSDLVANNVPIPPWTFTDTELYPTTLMLSAFCVIGKLPLASSVAVTVTAFPVFVPPEMYPAELVTDGVTVTE